MIKLNRISIVEDPGMKELINYQYEWVKLHPFSYLILKKNQQSASADSMYQICGLCGQMSGSFPLISQHLSNNFQSILPQKMAFSSEPIHLAMKAGADSL